MDLHNFLEYVFFLEFNSYYSYCSNYFLEEWIKTKQKKNKTKSKTTLMLVVTMSESIYKNPDSLKNCTLVC